MHKCSVKSQKRSAKDSNFTEKGLCFADLGVITLWVLYVFSIPGVAVDKEALGAGYPLEHGLSQQVQHHSLQHNTVHQPEQRDPGGPVG